MAQVDKRLHLSTNDLISGTNGIWQSAGGTPHRRMQMALLVVFLLGVANFAMHGAVLASGHPLLGQMPWYVHLLGGRISLAAEFLLLVASLLLSHYAAPAWAWGYLGYTVLNAIGAWLILSGRV